MPCKDYREALIEAAATHFAPPPELRSHLDSCAFCQTAFSEELQLFATIDAGVLVTANAEMPVSLLARVRAELDERSAPRRSWVLPFAAIAVAATLVLTVAFILGRDAADSNPRVGSVAHNVQPAETKPVSPTAIPLEKISPAAENKTVRAVTSAQTVKVEQVAVLVPAGQKQAIDALLVSVQRGKVEGDVLFAEKAEKTLQELQVAPLDLSPIELKPLEDVSAESPSPNKETRR